MPDWPPELLGYGAYGPLTTSGEGSPVADALTNANVVFTTAGAWAVANQAIFVPVVVRATTTVYQMAWVNGATVAGNLDVGIYNRAGTRLVSSGATAQSGTSATQAADITDTTLEAGVYYLAMAADDATATYNRAGLNIAAACRASGSATMASAYPLPSTATMVGQVATFGIPCLMGATESSVI